MAAARPDNTPKLWPWLRRALTDWAILIACFAAAYWAAHPAGWFAAMVVIGARQHALAILGHDGAHRLICRHRLLNDALTGMLCFWPMGFALNGYRRFHFKHHNAVGTDDDPELIHKHHKWLGQWRAPLRPWRLTAQLIADCLGGALPHLGMAAYLTRPTSWRDQIGPIITLICSLALCWWLGCLWIPALWFGSLWTTFFIVFRLRLWTEHVGTDGTHIITATWWQRFLFLPHNTWCHYEHHANAGVPCWALPAYRDDSAPSRSVGELFRDLMRLRRPSRSIDASAEPAAVASKPLPDVNDADRRRGANAA